MKVARVLAVVRPQRLALWPNLFVYPAMRRLPLSSLIARPFTSSPPPPPPPSDLDQKRTKRNRSLLYYLMAFTVTGLGGTTQRIDKSKRKKIDTSREFTVHFKGQTQGSLPWSFEPLQNNIDVHPGESALIFYNATNHSDEPIIGVATYMVAPSSAGKYFTKIECFCFDEQRIGPHESVNMPVLFTLDPEISDNVLLKDVRNITLSYTFFRSSDQNIYVEDERKETQFTPVAHKK